MTFIYEGKVHQLHATMRLSLRINEQVRSPVLNELTPFWPFLFVHLFKHLFIISYLFVLSSISFSYWVSEGRAIRIIVGGYLSYNALGNKGSPPEEVVFRLRPESKELGQGPGMGRVNAEWMEQCRQSPEVGMRCPSWLENSEGGPVCMWWSDKVPVRSCCRKALFLLSDALVANIFQLL